MLSFHSCGILYSVNLLTVMTLRLKCRLSVSLISGPSVGVHVAQTVELGANNTKAVGLIPSKFMYTFTVKAIKSEILHM